jgi:hypothetical protein
MQQHTITVADATDFSNCPFPLSVIPNHMGINLCSVDSVSWTEQDDGRLVNIQISFKPN